MLRTVKDSVDRVFNWKKYPDGVFFIALPLTALAMSLMYVRAYLEIKIHNDWGFLWIDIAGTIIGAVALTPPIRMIMELEKRREKDKGNEN